MTEPKKKNDYEIYKNIRQRDDYFAEWTEQSVKNLTEELKDIIYAKYLVKCEVFQRDGFKCQNTECEFPDHPLSMHHIKFKKNGGKDTKRNGVTLCIPCHKGYHRFKRRIVYPDADYLPSTIRGHTFQLVKPEEMDWKKLKAEMRTFRKNLKNQGIKNRMSWDRIYELMRWLFLDYDDSYEGELDDSDEYDQD